MIRFVACVLLWTGMGQADELWSDRDFYRAVSCGALPDEICKRDHRRWSPEAAQDLTIGIYQVQEGYPSELQIFLIDAFQLALTQINDARAAVQVRWLVVGAPDIRIYLVDARHSTTIAGTGFEAFDGAVIDHARTVSDAKGTEITLAAIALGAGLDKSDLQGLALRETLKALGFSYMIDEAEYAPVSILYAGDTVRETLGAPDIAALRTKYAY